MNTLVLFAKRLRRFFRRTLPRFLQPVIQPVRYFERTVRGRLGLAAPSRETETLSVFYDLAYWPITYDFVWFMIAADLQRQAMGLASIHVILVQADDWEAGNEARDYYKIIDGAARHQRVFDIIIPVLRLLPTVTGVTLASTRQQASRLADASIGHIFPPLYFPDLPNPGEESYATVMQAAAAGRAIPSLKTPPAATEWVERWRASQCDGRPYVTITLRYFAYNPVRNSNLEDWAAFVEILEEQGFRAVIVPDTHMTLDALPPALQGKRLCVEAAWHVPFRAALYEGAYLNLGINNGPMSLCWFNPRCRFIIFKQILEGSGVGELSRQLAMGIDPRKPIAFFTPFQKLVLDPDDLPVIRREFDAMHRRIETSPVIPATEEPAGRSLESPGSDSRAPRPAPTPVLSTEPRSAHGSPC